MLHKISPEVAGFIAVGARDFEGLNNVARRTNQFLQEKISFLQGQGPTEKEGTIAWLEGIGEALSTLRAEMVKCALAKSSLEQMVQSVVDHSFGKGSAETATRLKKYEEAEAHLEAHGPLDGNDEVSVCLKNINNVKNALQKG